MLLIPGVLSAGVALATSDVTPSGARPPRVLVRLTARPLLVDGRVSPVAFSPDGKGMAFVDYDLKRWRGGGFLHTLHMREVATGRELWKVEQGGPFGPVAFSPGGETLAVATRASVRLWDAATGKRLGALEDKDEGFLPPVITELAFTPDGRALAAVSAEQPLVAIGDADLSKLRPGFTLWEVLTGLRRRHCRGGAGVRYHLGGFTPDGRVRVWELRDGRGYDRLLDLSTGKVLTTIPRGWGHVRLAVLSPDGKSCFWQSAKYGDYDLVQWDVAAGKELRRFKGHQGSVTDLAFSVGPGGAGGGVTSPLLASAGADGTVRLWDVAAGRALHVLRGHEGQVVAAAFSPDGKLLASGGFDGQIILWDVSTGKARARLRGNQVRIASLCFSPDGRVLASWQVSAKSPGPTGDPTVLWDLTGRAGPAR
jgi:WD40 repeat protein